MSIFFVLIRFVYCSVRINLVVMMVVVVCVVFV